MGHQRPHARICTHALPQAETHRPGRHAESHRQRRGHRLVRGQAAGHEDLLRQVRTPHGERHHGHHGERRRQSGERGERRGAGPRPQRPPHQGPHAQPAASGQGRARERHGLRHRPRRHGQDLHGGGDGRARPKKQGRAPHHPHTPRRRGRREPGVPPRRPARQAGPLPPAPLRRPARHDTAAEAPLLLGGIYIYTNF